MSRRRRRNDWIPGAVITIIVIMLSVVFMGLLAMTKMIPTIYMLIIGIVLAVIGISQSIFGERDHWVGRFQIINRQFVTELELPGTINQIQITG